MSLGLAKQAHAARKARPRGTSLVGLVGPLAAREVDCDRASGCLCPIPQICHSKSGEINPVKVGNLVKAYVDKYRHMRRHRRPEAGEEPPAQGAEG